MWAWKITMCRLRPQMSRQSSLAVFLHWHWEAAYDLRMDRKMIFVLLLSGRWNFFFLSRILLYGQRRQWHPTPVLLPGKSHGQRGLVGCSPWSRWGSDTTERLHFPFSLSCIGRRKWQPTPVFLPGESQGRGSLVGCRLWGRIESDTTEGT